jgi:hypothetical protein
MRCLTDYDDPSALAPSSSRTGLLLALAAFWVLTLGSAKATLDAADTAASGLPANSAIDFNRDIRPILSNNCFRCHGPDPAARRGGKGGLRLDVRDEALADLGGHAAIEVGKPEASELVRRLRASDPDDAMPPPEAGKRISEDEIQLVEAWIRAGAPYAAHWSYSPPTRPAVPSIGGTSWPRNPIDGFVLERLRAEGLEPAEELDRPSLARRVSLDLIGLPPSIDDVDAFVRDGDPRAYENFVDGRLKESAYGEHWGRAWLDLARYADSSGYADDPPRTIWAYRDWVIRAFNQGMPFDRFTIAQIAGDLVPDADEETLVATAFHRNTLTNNEGGTNDEEFRNVAVVDRVNTTMAVWMGTTIDCAQCHSHKYDPITQEEYFRLFAILNNTEDADRGDESPRIDIWDADAKENKVRLEAEVARIEAKLATPTPELGAAADRWSRGLDVEPAWRTLAPSSVRTSAGASSEQRPDASILITSAGPKDDYDLDLSLDGLEEIRAIRVETLADDSLPGGGPGHAGGNFVITRVTAALKPPEGSQGTESSSARATARFVRIELSGKKRILSLAEVQVFSGADNVALRGSARQSSDYPDGPASQAIDGNTNGEYSAKSTTHTAIEDDPWWELDLGASVSIDRIVLWNRTDSSLESRLNGCRVVLLDESRAPAYETTIAEAPLRDRELAISGVRELRFSAAFAGFSQNGFDATNVLGPGSDPQKGWAVGPEFGKSHELTLVVETPVKIAAGSSLALRIEQRSAFDHHTIGRLRVAATGDPSFDALRGVPPAVIGIARKPDAERNDAERAELFAHWVKIAPELESERATIAKSKSQLAELKPTTSVPVLTERSPEQRRETRLQHRGNFLDLGPAVEPGVPAAFHPFPDGVAPDRLALARWLVDPRNPLTARVLANRVWEGIFGIGLVRTSEEFGSQGEPPSHPELLDWLALELVESGWDLRHLLRLIVTSSTYRQTSRVSAALAERDPENRLLARGPRFRMSAEMIRDQALYVSGLLSPKMYGPPVKPPQPILGVSAAFGGGIDWQTSGGEDRYRRAIYTTWRRSNPYPSMATFDAPNRETCTVRRTRTNTPLQALVTLNDPVYVEAAQALARRMAAVDGPPSAKILHGFRTCLARHPSEAESARLLDLFETLRVRFSDQREQAALLATRPLGPLPDGADPVELASWTIVANVLLNLDEMFMKR